MRGDLDRERIRLLVGVAEMYYQDGLRQDEIATKVGYSRATVSRLLDEAKLRGIVRFQIGHPLEHVIRLETELAAHFPKVRFHVGENMSPANAVPDVGRLAAELLARELRDGQQVGISTGSTVAAVADVLPQRAAGLASDLTFVQLVGTVAAHNAMTDGPELCRRFATAFEADFATLPAPLVARNFASARSFREDYVIAAALDRARNVDVALLGIGRFHQRNATGDILYGWTEQETRRQLAAAGAVAHVLGQFLGPRGEILNNEINRRIIGLELRELATIPRVIAVTAGTEKTRAILAALETGLIHDLVLDFETASTVLGAATR
ncbi:sugar-binding domain-containing protein [Mycobacterium sp. 236(2023)]|uniref:sugar-binding transcriptional regulator n=1 Tax=Mycobacterium sp. 236(2023) TaxID=3038163 RepID=UPI0024154D7C|nr:sugar-binding domain-containing protein [Mycobacterium sp. 236(2023)]MDG4667125.1 sugar-binding domain-containing protein [Mycobacterium sp. 236(2023)]